MADDYNGTPLPDSQDPGPDNSDQNDNIPDWMKEAGWETSSGTFDESKPVFDDMDDDDDEIVPADIPAWLEEAAPEGFSSDPNATPAFEGLDVDEPFITTGDLVPPPSLQDVPEKDPEPDKPPVPAKPEGEETFDIPTWLENLELDEDSQETAVAWLENMPEDLRATEEELQASRDFPTEEPEIIEEPVDELAWIDEIDISPEQSVPDAYEEQAELSEDLVASELIPEAGEPETLFEQDEIESMESELPSWLKELGDDEPESQVVDEIQPTPPSEEPEIKSERKEEALPDWLRTTDETDLPESVESPAVEEIVEPEPQVSDDDSSFPDWLGEFEDGVSETEDESDSLEWLDSLAAEETTPEEVLPTSIEDLIKEAGEEKTTPEEALPTSIEDLIKEASEEKTTPEEAPPTSIEDLIKEASEEKTTPEEAPPTSIEDLVKEASEEDLDQPDLIEEAIPSEPTTAQEEISQLEGVSPNDETLNAQVPDWLSKIEEDEDIVEEETVIPQAMSPIEETELPRAEDDFETSGSWLDQISEEPPDVSRDEISAQESEVSDWLDDMDELRGDSLPDDLPLSEEPSAETPPEEPAPVELETAKYFPPEETSEEEAEESLPDWLSELREDDEEPLSLEDAIRQSDHELNDEEVDFLSKVDEKHEDEADWLSKLEQTESQPDDEPYTPAIEPDPIIAEEEIDEPSEEPILAGGMLDRLKDTAEFKSGEDVPQWLADIKEEEDPQETAVLWLQQFVNQGDRVDIKNEIKRYTDELDPGDSIPKWMEDLKNEEDPQTTAMLWLEKLSASRQPQPKQKPEPPKEDDSGWLADLEREASEASADKEPEKIEEFDTPDEGWLADLEIDEKLKTAEEDIPEWSKTEGESPEGEPPWMKATSPLEGDFYTDELAGGEEKEVEIPEWLAGYAEGERPEEVQESQDEEEYTWLSATDSLASRTPLDLNKAAISQLEGILGISHQIARGIVSYREKHGPFRDFSDLKNVPEITDEQTIDILKPEVYIEELQVEEEPPAPIPTPEPTPPAPVRKPAKKTSKPANFEEILVTARARINDRSIDEATDLYSSLIKKKKFLDEVIEDLQKASLDHPLEISIQKTLGDAFMQKDMLDEALEAYSKAEDLLS